jgi:hypothetical protein
MDCERPGSQATVGYAVVQSPGNGVPIRISLFGASPRRGSSGKVKTATVHVPGVAYNLGKSLGVTQLLIDGSKIFQMTTERQQNDLG